MRPRVNVTARDLTPVSFFFHLKAPFLQKRDHVACQYAHTLLFTEVSLTTVAKIRTIASSYWPRKCSVQNF